MIPALIMFSGLKYLKPENAGPLMTISGGLLSIIILALYPIMLFNKAYSKVVEKDHSQICLRTVNWIIFGVMTGLGCMAVKQGIMSF